MKFYEVTFHVSAPAEIMSDALDLLAAIAGETGFETFEETDNGLKGYVQTHLFDRDSLDNALKDFPFTDAKISYEVCEAEYCDWNEQWEQEGFEPIVIGDRCTIHDGRHLPQQKTEVEVEIDAHLSFGTGNHETTRLMVSALMDIDLHGKSVLDAGCGTGILGITALKHGARSVVGYDIDEWSADNARHNAVINMVGDYYETLLGDATLLDNIGRKFDVVVANINRNILLADMPRLVSVLNSNGSLLLSGFYTDDEETLKKEAESLGLALQGETSDNSWACLAFKHQSE